MNTHLPCVPRYIAGGLRDLDYKAFFLIRIRFPQFFTKKAVTEAWPRGAALAEATWSGQRRPGFSDFQRRLQLLQPLLRQNQDGTCQKWKHFKDAVNDLNVFSLSRFFPR